MGFRKSSLKYRIKSIIPNNALLYLRRMKALAEAMHYWQPYVFKNGKANHPTSLVLELTYRCNLKCRMCPQAIDFQNPESVMRAQMLENRELATDDIIKVVKQAATIGTKNMTVTGGEPFIRKDILEIVSTIKSKKISCYLITNGDLITAAYSEELVKIGVDKIIFSLDGPEDIHNKIRRNNKQFQNVINSIKSIQKDKKLTKSNVPDLTLNMTVNALNADRMNEVIDIAAREKVNVNYGYVFYTAKKMKEKTIELYPPTGGKFEDQDIPMELRKVDVNMLAKEIENTREKAKKMGVKINIQPYITSPDGLFKRFYDDEHAYVRTCFYPWYAMRINPYGDVYPCQMNIKIGNIREKTLIELWNNETYLKFRKDLRNVGIWPQCTKCCALNNKLWDRLPKMRWYWGT